MPKPKISQEELIYRCKLGIFEDIVVEGLGYITTAYSLLSFINIPNWENGIGTAADVWRFEQIQNISNSKYDIMTQAAMLWGLRRTPY